MTDTSATLSLQDTVLLVDDDIFVRTEIADYLRRCGYRVIEAAGADEALLLLEKNDGGIDIVLTDVEMPGTMDGFELAQWIRARLPGIDVILAGSVPRAASAASDLCDSGSLPKPYDPQILLKRIQRLRASRGRT